jgi:hypothetical protein
MFVTSLQEVIVVLNDEQKFIYASYLYYWLDVSPMSDYEYDMLARKLLENYDSLTNKFKYRLTREALEAGTGYFLEYTEEEIFNAEDWADSLGLR